MASVLFVGLAACGGRFAPFQEPPPEDARLRLDLTTFEKVPGWKADTLSETLPVFIRSCEKLETQPPDRKIGPPTVPSRVSDWLAICTDARLIRPGNETETRYFFESRFQPHLVSNDANPRGLFTGYYEPELRGAWQPDPTYRYPIYARPKDLISIDLGKFQPEMKNRNLAGRLEGNKFAPYPTRADIENGVLKGQQLELLWVDDAIDAFFLHVQGSGRVVFADSTKVRLAYAGRNGHRYTPIGRELAAMGAIPEDKISMQSIRKWLAASPVAGREIMERNKSYIFFRLMDGDGPIGAQGVVLTAGRSLAVDQNFIPLGTPVWLSTSAPGKSRSPLRRLVIAQDTGSAIRGPVRGDLFFGFGNDAAIKAGRMKQKGTYYLLLPRRNVPES